MQTRPTFIIPVHGTWDISDNISGHWYQKDSAFCSLAQKNNVFFKGDEPFIWSGRVDGINWKAALTLNLLRDKHDDWRTSGFSLRNYLKQFKVYERNIIAHSHALQVLAYADIQVNNIITVGSPIRKDMEEKYFRLKNHSKNWMHIRDARWDWMGTLGQAGDGKWFGKRTCLIPGVTEHALQEVSHSKILRDIHYMQMWETQGWFDFLRL